MANFQLDCVGFEKAICLIDELVTLYFCSCSLSVNSFSYEVGLYQPFYSFKYSLVGLHTLFAQNSAFG